MAHPAPHPAARGRAPPSAGNARSARYLVPASTAAPKRTQPARRRSKARCRPLPAIGGLARRTCHPSGPARAPFRALRHRAQPDVRPTPRRRRRPGSWRWPVAGVRRCPAPPRLPTARARAGAQDVRAGAPLRCARRRFARAGPRTDPLAQPQAHAREFRARRAPRRTRVSSPALPATRVRSAAACRARTRSPR